MYLITRHNDTQFLSSFFTPAKWTEDEEKAIRVCSEAIANDIAHDVHGVVLCIPDEKE